MKKSAVIILLTVLIPFLGMGEGVKLSFPEAIYGFGKWDAEPYGNYRAVVEVKDKDNAVYIRLPWRRRDSTPVKKQVIITDASTGKQIKNVYCPEINREYGDIVFQPQTVPGKYYIYYMPYELTDHDFFPTTKYLLPANTADADWKSLLLKSNLNRLKKARLIKFEARDRFYSVYPMEVIATKQETENLIKASGKKEYLLFPEFREYPIAMKNDLPLRWIKRGPSEKFSAQARPGEYYAFQIGYYALSDVNQVNVSFESESVDSSAFTCFNTGGIDWKGQNFEKDVPVKAGQVQALWCGVQVPENFSGELTGKVKIQPLGLEESDVAIKIAVSGAVLADGGVSDIKKLSKLKWLNSTIGVDDEVFGIYTPVTFSNNEIGILGRKITLDKSGLPSQITSMFDDMSASTNGPAREMLSTPMRMAVEENGDEIRFNYSNHNLIKKASGAIEIQTNGTSKNLETECSSKIECDGYANYSVKIKVKNDCNLNDIRLEIPMKSEIAEYMMGMGCKGGKRPDYWEWDWNPRFNNGEIWLGTVGAGLQCRLKGLQDIWSSNLSSGYLKDWYNDGKGACNMQKKDSTFLVKIYTGNRKLEKGDELLFRFGLLITPVRPLDNSHWNWRYWHTADISNMGALNRIDNVASEANIINIHHGNKINPYINYPFLKTDTLKKYVAAAHRLDKKVKLYYTVRELTVRSPETFALRSLGHEVYLPGQGIKGNITGESWMCEHLIDDYQYSWHQYFGNNQWDEAIAQTGLSRWHNFYLEGVNWLIKNMGIDGLYIDVFGYDREITKRLRKVMDRARPGCLIDLHSWDHFVPEYGRNSSASLFMEHFPFINSLWFGEIYDYNETPDYWLIELSGIPYGLFGEMLQDGGNIWRGMVYGMTNRLKFFGDPRPIWKLWDDFGIEKSKMLGYWSKRCPVKTDDDNIKATAYIRDDKTLIAIGNWDGNAEISLAIDWDAIGIEKSKAIIYAPEMEGIQAETSFLPDEPIPVEAGKGWFLIIKQNR